MEKLLAQGGIGSGNKNPFGIVQPPSQISAFSPTPGAGIGKIIQYALWILIIGAAVYSLFNFVIAGYSFLSAGDDSKKVAGAWATIWQSILGLGVAAGAFVIAAIVGKLIFGDYTFILNPQLPTL